MRNPLKNAWQSLLHDRRHLVFALLHRIPWIIPNDELYLKIYFWLSMRKKLNLNNPQTYNEKLQWLKLYNRRPEYVELVDKYAVKDYISKKIGAQYVVPLIAVWDKPEDIDWDILPDKFVLKTNHDGGKNGIVVCKDKSMLSKKKALRELRHSFYRNTYMIGREWPYKMVKRRVFAEKYMEDSNTGELRDYKFICFNGEVKLCYVKYDQHTGHEKLNFYDKNFAPIKMGAGGHDYGNEVLPKPVSFDKMVEFASLLSKEMPCVRMDFYEVDGNLYFGEYTFFDGGGCNSFDPPEWDNILGDCIKLPTEKIIA